MDPRGLLNRFLALPIAIPERHSALFQAIYAVLRLMLHFMLVPWFGGNDITTSS